MIVAHKKSLIEIRESNREYIMKMPIRIALGNFLNNLKENTRIMYSYAFNDFFRRKIVGDCTVEEFNRVNHEMIIDHIKNIEEWKETTRQFRCAVYISFTSYLARITQGLFRKAVPSTLASNKTFYQVHEKCVTKSLTIHEWNTFIDALYKISIRDALIAKCMLQGAKRISEVLEVDIDDVDLEKNIITFRQKKIGFLKKIPITFPERYIKELKEYVNDTIIYRAKTSALFVTNRGNRIKRMNVNVVFAKASYLAGIPCITPHSLRTTWITLAKQQGIQDTEIMKVTGHSSSKMIYAYDKTSLEDNCSKKMILI